MMLTHIIIRIRNGIWRLRRWIRHDPFEHAREAWTCGTVAETVDSMRDLLAYWGFEVNHLEQFEDEGQVLSGRWKCEWDGMSGHCKRQYHFRFFDSSCGLEVRAHKEYTPEYDPIKHINAVGIESGCDYFWMLYNETKRNMR